MPREKASERQKSGLRLRKLRDLLGFTQREMAGELAVTHGAIAGWESGKNPMPGPVQKLVSMYEAELGISDGEGDAALPASLVSRNLALTQLATNSFAKVAAATLERMLADEADASVISARMHASIARHLVLTLSELKGVAMKLGQTLAYVDSALPEASRAELRSLMYHGRAMTHASVTQIFLEELGAPPRQLFQEWEPTPFAAASIGQVHRARLTSGEAVAVKVQYPAIARAVQSDLSNAAIVDRLTALLFRGQEPGVWLAELRERFDEECDYRIEARNQEDFRRIWNGRPGIRIPRVHHQLSTSKILVSDFVDGSSFDEFVKCATREEKDRVGLELWQFAFESIFSHGLFNADPQPGNYLFVDSEIAFLDFGCTKRFPGELVASWMRLIRVTLERDFDAARRAWVEMGMVRDPSRYDFDHHVRMMLVLYEPWLGPYFEFTREYVERTWRMMATENPNKFRLNVPKDWVFANRLQWGLGSVLAELGARGDFRTPLLDLLYEAGEPRPEPFSARELALLTR